MLKGICILLQRYGKPKKIQNGMGLISRVFCRFRLGVARHTSVSKPRGQLACVTTRGGPCAPPPGPSGLDGGMSVGKPPCPKTNEEDAPHMKGEARKTSLFFIHATTTSPFLRHRITLLFSTYCKKAQTRLSLGPPKDLTWPFRGPHLGQMRSSLGPSGNRGISVLSFFKPATSRFRPPPRPSPRARGSRQRPATMSRQSVRPVASRE